jgi:hypothetical protein
MVQLVWAQNPNLEINLTKRAGTQAEWELNIRLSLTNNLDSGLLIELPSRIKTAPAAVKINDKDIWLKNDPSFPESESVVNWESTADGLVLRFKKNVLKAFDRLSVNCASHIEKMPGENSKITIKKIIQQEDKTIQKGDIIASKNFPTVDKNKR